MITRENLEAVLSALGYTKDLLGSCYTKTWPDTGASVSIDFDSEKISYPTSVGFKVNVATTCNFSDNENFVVLACVTKLFDKGYRPESIELERQWSLGHEQKSGRADICVNDERGDTLAIIECKTPGKEYRDEWRTMQSDGGQLFSYWQQERASRWLVLFACDYQDGDIILFQKSVTCEDDENYKELAKKDDSIALYATAHTVEMLYEVWTETYNQQTEGNILFGERSTAYHPTIPPLLKKDLVDFTADDRIVNRFEEILRHNNVSDKENAFNRLVALFIAKLQDELSKTSNQEVDFQYRQGRDTYESLQDRLQRLHSEGMRQLMREDVLYVPSNYAESVISRYTGQRRAKLIAELNETLRKLKFYTNSDFAFKDVHNEQLFLQNSKVLVEVVQLLQPYRIVDSGDVQFLGDLFEQLLNQGFKQNEGQFFTPMPITRFIWKSLPLDDILRGNGEEVYYPRVIDYACGAGHFLTEGFEQILEAAVPYDPYFQYTPNEDREWVRNGLVGVEKDYRLARVSRISLFMHGAGRGEIVFGDGLENYPEKGIDSRRDAGQFDILTANPPYSVAAFKPHLQLHNNDLELLEHVSDNGSEIETLFVERAAQLVRPGGYAAIILPSSILDKGTNSSFIAARDVLLRSFELVAIARFGSGTFAATGTNVAILFLRRFDEVPTRDDCAQDFVEAVFGKANLDGWKDADDFAAYLDMIRCDKSDYAAFVGRATPWQEWEDSLHFGTYYRTFEKSATLRNVRKTRAYKAASQDDKQLDEDLAFYRFAHDEERERLRVFALVRGERTLVVNSPTQTSEIAAFLGYKWSNRKGNEGIQIIEEGGALYANGPMGNEPKLCDVIRTWFAGGVLAAEDLSQYFYYADTQDFIDFDGERFDKSLRMPRTYYKPRVYAPGVKVASLGDVAGYVTKAAGKDSIVLDSYVTTENMVKGRLGITPYKGDAPASGGTAYRQDDTLVSNIRPYLQKIWLADRDGACSKDVLVFRSKDTSRVLPEFLHMLLWQSDFFDYDMSTFTGTGRPRGDKDALLGYRIPLPSIGEQGRIVQAFKTLTGSIEDKNVELTAIEEGIRARFIELFGDPADNPRRWKTTGLMELGTCRNGLNYSSSEHGVQIPCLGVADFKNRSAIEGTGELGAISLNTLPGDECFLKDGDIVFVRSNGNKELVGRCLVVYPHKEKAVYSGFCIRLRLTSKQVLAPYIVSALKQPSMRSKMFGKGSNIQNLNQEMLAAISIPVPPMDLQAEFAEYLTSSSGKQAELYQQIEALCKERDSLLDCYLSK